MINEVHLIGNVGKEPEFKVFANGGEAVRFTVATESGYFNDAGDWIGRTEWHNIRITHKTLVERVRKHVVKGSQVFIRGSIRYESYEDSQGVRKYFTEIIVDTLRVLKQPNTHQPQTGPQQTTGAYSDFKPPGAAARDFEVKDDLPF